MCSGTKHFGSSPVSLLMGSRRGVRPQWSQQEEKKTCLHLFSSVLRSRDRQCASRIANTRHSFCGCVVCCRISPPGQTETLFFRLWVTKTLKAISEKWKTPLFKKEKESWSVISFLLSRFFCFFLPYLSNSALYNRALFCFLGVRKP